MINPHDLILKKATLQIRHPVNFLSFDYSGKLCQKFLDRNPNWILASAAPDKLEFSKPSADLSSTCTLQSIQITQQSRPDKVLVENEFKTDAGAFLGQVFEVYPDITEFVRLGYQKDYVLPAKSPEACLQRWNSLQFLSRDKEFALLSAGEIVLRIKVDNDVSLRFSVINIDHDINLGPVQYHVASGKIYHLTSEARETADDLKKHLKEKTKLVDSFGMYFSFDWYRNDVINANKKDAMDFMQVCDNTHFNIMIRKLIGGTS